MPASGARSGTAPSRPKPSGTGRVGEYLLTCGHVSPKNPVFRTAGANSHSSYWCDECGSYRRRR